MRNSGHPTRFPIRFHASRMPSCPVPILADQIAAEQHARAVGMGERQVAGGVEAGGLHRLEASAQRAPRVEPDIRGYSSSPAAPTGA